MPKSPKNAPRPADANKLAHRIMQIATGEVEEPKSVPRGQAGGKAGGAARAASLPPERRAEIAKSGARVRWKKA